MLQKSMNDPSPTLPELVGRGKDFKFFPFDKGMREGIPGFMQETFMSVLLTLQNERKLSCTDLMLNSFSYKVQGQAGCLPQN